MTGGSVGRAGGAGRRCALRPPPRSVGPPGPGAPARLQRPREPSFPKALCTFLCADAAHWPDVCPLPPLSPPSDPSLPPRQLLLRSAGAVPLALGAVLGIGG